jgi:hypothetical protein
VGSAHRFSDIRRPHNSLHVISDSGEFEARYDKRFCAGGSDEQSGDLAHYSPGGHSSTWSIDGVLCGALICHDYRYPELYREYSSFGVFFVRADGITIGRLRRNVPGILLTTVDTEQELYDSTRPWRQRAISGVLHSGTLAPEDE